MLALTTFTKGLVIGFTIAMIIGPIAILSINKTLKYGRLSGFFTTLGAAVADGIYGAIGIFGIKIIMNFLTSYTIILRVLGGLFLGYLAIKTITKKVDEKKGNEIEVTDKKTLAYDFLSTFFLTMSNPMTIAVFMGIFVGLGITGAESISLSILMVLGVFIGSIAFYIILVAITSIVRHKISTKTIRKINIISGVVLMLFAITSFISLF